MELACSPESSGEVEFRLMPEEMAARYCADLFPAGFRTLSSRHIERVPE